MNTAITEILADNGVNNKKLLLDLKEHVDAALKEAIEFHVNERISKLESELEYKNLREQAYRQAVDYISSDTCGEELTRFRLGILEDTLDSMERVRTLGSEAYLEDEFRNG